MNIHDFNQMKRSAKPIVMATCYSYWAAQLMAETEVDCLLVGDSVAMVEHGYSSTLQATVEMMERHVDAVARGAPRKFIVGDMPFLSYRKGLVQAVEAVERLMRVGAHAVKLEGAVGHLDIIRHIVDSGVPVMGHLGLTPQSVHALGGYALQGRGQEAADRLYEEAHRLQEAGCFALVLECVPEMLAERITESLLIPTIGIGAGSKTSGQVLVFHDMLGLNDFKAKFMKRYLNGADQMKSAINAYSREVRALQFPAREHCYHD